MRTKKNGIAILRWRCCENKEQYDSLEEAELSASTDRAKGDKGIVGYGPCPNCGKYHKGHKRIELKC